MILGELLQHLSEPCIVGDYGQPLLDSNRFGLTMPVGSPYFM
jgi:hypothetical protein